MTDLDKLRDDAEAARRYAEYHGGKTWTEHIFAPLALADAALARIARAEALHGSGPVHIVASDGATASRLTCLHCSRVQPGEIVQPGDAYVWPCPTVRALTEGGPDAAL